MEYYISRSHLLPRLISSIDGERSFFLKISIIIRDKMFNRINNLKFPRSRFSYTGSVGGCKISKRV